MSAEKVISVSELNIFPIKSCKGFSLTESVTTLRGFAWDRQWMIVQEDGNFLTQRQIPRMSQILPKVEAESPDSLNVYMHLSAPDMPPLTIESSGIGETRKVVVWNDACDAVDEGVQAAEWLSHYLKTPCSLVRFASQFVRRVDFKYKNSDVDQVGFADGFPFLIISKPSLADLNERLPEKLPMNRFRPNIVVTGCSPFDEDNWKTIKINNLLFHVVKPCARCVITCTDQQTSKVGVEPLRTLSTYRTQMNKIMFGQNLVPEGAGVVKVGDKLEVVR